ncbi:MAG: phenylacetate-CoA oxygenase subunit PaaC [Bacteroidetes bacterium]|nr:phenylacetate-CoA oxygenase subunit PaaC [Bacteroidota bacterium]
MDTNHNKNLFDYCLRIADTSLVLGQRLGEWCGHAPILEEDIALTNISLDLIGQARMLLEYAGQVEGKGRTEDDLAYFRGEREFRNLLLAEQPNGDFGQTIMRQFLLSTYQYYFFTGLTKSSDTTLSALAEKSVKEVAYHVRHSSEWVKRLGSGTPESHQRMMNAVDELWMYTGDLFDADQTDAELTAAGIGVDLSQVKLQWENKVNEIFAEATLPVPQNIYFIKGSREGKHTEHLGHLLAEMQSLARAFPGAGW